jgi:hypothetical protein
VGVCAHLEAVVEELERRGCARVQGWLPHRNDLLYTVFISKTVPAAEMTSLAPAWLCHGERTGCFRANHTHVSCGCEDGRYKVVVIAERDESL